MKIVNSLKLNLVFKGIILIAILLLYYAFAYIIYPNINYSDLEQTLVVKTTNVVSILFLILILLLTVNFMLSVIKIFRFKSNIDEVIQQHVENDAKLVEKMPEIKQDPVVSNNKKIERIQAEKIKDDRLSTMGSLAAGIIHDFKNPITNISLFTQLIRMGQIDEGKRILYLGKIEDQVDRMLNMTQDFLDYARGQKTLKMMEIEFTQTLSNQIEFHREKSDKKNIRLEYSLPDPFYVKMDIHKFRRVLDNLISNAFEVLKSGQFIMIDVTNQETGINIKISDNGHGIHPKILPKIFDPFFSAGKEKGSGLGLSISKKIVEDHGGTLTVNSEMGKGTDFIITLPSNLICQSKPKLKTPKVDSVVI
jgi:signal transduction histidine kinase